MTRKPKTVFRLLTEKPWWFSAGLALVVYAVLAYLLPMFKFDSPVTKGFVQGLIYLAPVFALLLLIPAVISAHRAWKKQEQKK